ncbi:MAG: polysaccharide deacetylase family protein [Myxococcales bacterium]|nr:polysaccharide deacetylase family protein [Myxococcales bacterium]
MIFCVSIDLDPLRCYREIFGLPAQERADPLVERALPRFCQLLASLGVPGTAFVVGASVAGRDNASARRAVKAAAAAGIEIANHTSSHPYRLSAMSEREIAEEIQDGDRVLRRLTGARAPLGFRAPGYNLGPRVLPAAIRVGVRYDSSILPSLSYRVVKAAALVALRIRGRRSLSLLGDLGEARAPITPYRPDPARPARRGDAPLIELPIGTVMDLPLVGGMLAMLGEHAVPWIARSLRKKKFVNLELHGVDFLDAKTDAIEPALARAQLDLRIPWKKKAAVFAAFIGEMKKSHQCLTLSEASRLSW